MAVSPVQPVIRFGLFELDPRAGQLSCQGTRLRLPQQPVQLLAVLLERPGEIFSRDELQRRLWPSDVFVDFDHGLTNPSRNFVKSWETPQLHPATSKPSRASATVLSLPSTPAPSPSLLPRSLPLPSRNPLPPRLPAENRTSLPHAAGGRFWPDVVCWLLPS
jgi:hypothetical protein